MYLCDPCHGHYECPARKHELVFLASCDVCRRERDCFDCTPRAEKRPGPSTGMKMLKSYDDISPISYPSAGRRRP